MNGQAINKASVTPLMYYMIYKPYGVLSQFSAEGDHPGLGSLFDFPSDVYPVGRLDVDSEGLLILTNDTSLNHALLNPQQAHWRTYWVQVEGEVSPEALLGLQRGVSIRIQKKDYNTLPAEAGLFEEAIPLPERNPPVRFRKNIPTSWLYLRLREGKNRQVRRMTAAVGYPTLRLVRVAIEDLELQAMQPGEVHELSKQSLYKLLKLKPEEMERRQQPGRIRTGKEASNSGKSSFDKSSFRKGKKRY